MILVGVVKHFMSKAMASVPKVEQKAFRERSALLFPFLFFLSSSSSSPPTSCHSQALAKGKLLQVNGRFIPAASFARRKEILGEKFLAGEYLRNPNQSALDAFADPTNMNGMMDGMIKNMAVFIPQSMIFGWVSYFFTGFVLSKTFTIPLKPLHPFDGLASD